MLIKWNKNYSVGIAKLDEQHQQLIEMLNQLYQEIGPEIESSKVWPLLDAFNRYADTHFRFEERLVREHALPQDLFLAHRAEHEGYCLRLAQLQQNFHQGDRHAPIQLMSFLSNWWLSHILVSDMALGKLIRECGVS